MLTRHTEAFYVNQASNKTPAWNWNRHSKPTACFLYQIERSWFSFSTRMVNPQLLHCKSFEGKKSESGKKTYFIVWDTEFTEETVSLGIVHFVAHHP